MKKIISLLILTVTLLSVPCASAFAEDYDSVGSDNAYYEDSEFDDYDDTDSYYSDTSENGNDYKSTTEDSPNYVYEENGITYRVYGDTPKTDNPAPDIYSEEGLKKSIETGTIKRSQNAYFKDEAEILKGREDEIFNSIQQTADKIDMNVAVFIGGLYRNDKVTEDFTALANEKIFGKGDYTNSVFLYLDLEGAASAYDFIDTYHDAYFYYPDDEDNNRIDAIWSDMDHYLPPSGTKPNPQSINSAIEVFLKDLVKFKNMGMVDGLYYKNAETNLYHITIFGTIIISPIMYKHLSIFIIIALIGAILVWYTKGKRVRTQYKFRSTVSASEYTHEQQVLSRSDNFIKEYTTSHKIESSSSSSHHSHSSGSHHSSSRSSSHHGGGHHR